MQIDCICKWLSTILNLRKMLQTTNYSSKSNKIKHEYLRSRHFHHPSQWQLFNISTLDFIEIFVLISWISHPGIFCQIWINSSLKSLQLRLCHNSWSTLPTYIYAILSTLQTEIMYDYWLSISLRMFYKHRLQLWKSWEHDPSTLM